jgi:osmotically-inducible protein OsmY
VSHSRGTTARRQPRLTSEVFVGNRCIADNIAECVKVAIFNAIGAPAHGVTVTVDRGVARLEGFVGHETERSAAAIAAISQAGIEAVDDRLSVMTPAQICRREPSIPRGAAAAARVAPPHRKSGDPK